MDQDSVVSIATRYGLGGPGIKSLWRRYFPHLSKAALGPRTLIHNGYRVSFPGVQRLGRGVHNTPQSSAEVSKERIELHLYSAFGPSRPLLGLNSLDNSLPVLSQLNSPCGPRSAQANNEIGGARNTHGKWRDGETLMKETIWKI